MCMIERLKAAAASSFWPVSMPTGTLSVSLRLESDVIFPTTVTTFGTTKTWARYLNPVDAATVAEALRTLDKDNRLCFKPSHNALLIVAFSLFLLV